MQFERGPIPYAVRATLALTEPEPIERVTFTVQTKPGNAAADVRVTYARSFLDRTGALDEVNGEVVFTVFGLYHEYDNQVLVDVEFATSAPLSNTYVVNTLNDPPQDPPDGIDVQSLQAGLDVSYMFMQRFTGPTIVDIDGEVRWFAPTLADIVFPRACTPEGIVLGALNSNAIYNVDWLGSVTRNVMSDPRCTTSHHNIEPGKTGFLNTVAFVDGAIDRPESVLAEMTQTGTITKLWDFDQIFSARISGFGEDPSTFVQNGVDWFHMNSAVYDATDDSVIASSRENFVVKADYETGAIRWILGNPGKLWYTAYPLSLQPLALTVIGDAPIGQHSLSISADGELLTCFNNGLGNTNLPDVGDSQGYSKVSVYRIDETLRTATEVLSLDFAEAFYSPICSSAYRTAGGNMLVTFSAPDDNSPPRLFVVNDAGEVLFEAFAAGDGCAAAYATQEFELSGLLID
ncbi:MAG: aryl-sulfate sulfotransferase [Planctomycetota bacterium]|nr:aryl-sulfate sulfotransferase [Planctomycetota bacterium]